LSLPHRGALFRPIQLWIGLMACVEGFSQGVVAPQNRKRPGYQRRAPAWETQATMRRGELTGCMTHHPPPPTAHEPETAPADRLSGRARRL
jgi:hypothetical protein